MKALVEAKDFTTVGKDFSCLLYLTGEESGYIYISYINGVKLVEPVKHESANIFLTMSTELFGQMVSGNIDVFRAFTSGKIQAKGNVFLALAVLNALK